MFKVYYYTDSEVGLPWLGPDADRVEHCKKHGLRHPRFIWYDWPRFTETHDPGDADVFVVRQRLAKLSEDQLRSLPYLRDRVERHVFFDLAENYQHYPSIVGAISIRGTCTRSMLKWDPGIVPWSAAVNDYGEYSSLPQEGFKHDVVFQGQTGGSITEPVLKSVERSQLSTHICRLRMFFGYYKDPEEIATLRKSYLESMSLGRLALSPASLSRGAIRYRVYEAMSMARVSVILCDSCVMPLQDQINWSHCLLRLPECEASNVGVILEGWLQTHTDQEIVEMGRYARQMWEKWLWRERWGEVIGMLVRERLEKKS